MKAIIAFFLLTFFLGSFAPAPLPEISIYGTVYDFSNGNRPGGHPDFDTYLCGVQKGMVETQLGDDNKPVLADKKSCLTSTDSFNQWFRDTPGVNYVFDNVQLVAYWDDSSQSYKYRNDAFFPVDDKGYGYEGMSHNFGFCFEYHAQFTYQGGEVFDFTGDDDVWVFINKQLVIDLGGVHGAASDSVSVDSLGLTKGETYALDFFFCERHEVESHMWFSTDIVIDPCGTADGDGDGHPDLCDPCPNADMDFDAYTDDNIGPDNTVIFYINLKTATTQPYTIVIDFGDGVTESHDVSAGFSVPHSYKTDGTYTVTFQGSNVPGCGKGTTSDITVKVGGKRLAPKCSELSVVPGTPSKRKRNL